MGSFIFFNKKKKKIVLVPNILKLEDFTFSHFKNLNFHILFEKQKVHQTEPAFSPGNHERNCRAASRERGGGWAADAGTGVHLQLVHPQ